MLILQQIFLGLLFIISVIVCFIPITFFVLSKIKNEMDDIEKVVVSAVCGMVIFTIFAYILSAVSLRFLMWAFPIAGTLLLIKYKDIFLSLKFSIQNKAFFIVTLLIGMIGMVAVNAPSGLPYEEGIYFWSSHGHDGIWHLSLMEHIQKNIFPFQNPELAGEKLQNYHFFVDLLMSEFSRLFYFSNLDIYFRFMPVIFSLLLGLSAFIFVRAWSKKEIAGIWAMIFVYFSGSFGYLLYIPTHKSLGGESIFWVSQTQSVLGNPPHAAAFIIVTVLLFLLLRYLNTRKFFYFLPCVLLGGAVIEFKVYAGVLILGGLLVIGLFELIFKKIYKTALLFILTLLVALIVYLPNSANSQEFLIWHPWWFIRTMVVATDRLNWLDLELRRQTYIAEHNWKRVIQLEGTAFLIFLFGNLGMRFLGFFTIFKQVRENIFKNTFNLFFLTITIASFFLPVFFLQKGVVWNVIQFNQYFLLLFGFLAAITTTDLIGGVRNKLLKFILASVIILLAIPTQAGLLWQFYSSTPLSKISFNELEALEFLKKNAKDTDKILTAPFNRYERDKYKNPPVPIHTWYDTGYVAAFSSKETLISDEEQLTIMAYEVKEIFEEREEIFKSTDAKKINSYLEKFGVNYIYLVWDQKFATDSATLNIESVFENENAKIYQVK